MFIRSRFFSNSCTRGRDHVSQPVPSSQLSDSVRSSNQTDPGQVQLLYQLRAKYQAYIKEKHDQQITELYHRFARINAAYKKIVLQVDVSVEQLDDGSWGLSGPSTELMSLIKHSARCIAAVYMVHRAIFKWSERLFNLEIMLSINQDATLDTYISELQTWIASAKVHLCCAEEIFWKAQQKIDSLQDKLEPWSLNGENSVINKYNMLYADMGDPRADQESKSATRPRFNSI
jgi:hypothetical protein